MLFRSVGSLPLAAHAFCISGTLAVEGNNCTTFYSGSSSTSQATVRFSDPKLNNSVSPFRNGARYFQIVMNTITGGSYNVVNLEWSHLPRGPFTQFQSSLTVGTTKVASRIVDIFAETGTRPLGSPFFVRYTLPAGVPIGEIFEVKFLANNNGHVGANGLLDGNALTSFVDLNRDNVSRENVPGPLPVVGVFMALGGASRFRRRLKAASATK